MSNPNNYVQPDCGCTFHTSGDFLKPSYCASHGVSAEELRAVKDQLAAAQAAIRKHRDQRGDDRCWMDDDDLYSVLPEGFTPPERDTFIEIANCERFLRTRLHPAMMYISAGPADRGTFHC